MRFIVVFLILLLSFQVRAADHLAAILPSFEAYVQKTLTDWNASGVAVVIVKDGQIVYEKGFGVKDVREKDPIDVHTVFQIASLTKNFLVTLVAQLVDEGILDWDAPVKRYLTDFQLSDPAITEQFTLRDLLSHRSGLKAFSADSLWNLGFSAQEIRQGLAKIPFLKGFRQDYGYQNHMFSTASQLVEKVTGRSISDLFTERFFKPLGLNDSSVGPMEQSDQGWLSRMWTKLKNLFKKTPKANIAIPHHILDGKTVPLPVAPMMYTFNGSTGINTSIHDLGQWLIFQLNSCQVNRKYLVSLAQQKQMRTSHIHATNLKPDDIQFPAIRMHDIHYGMGWFLGQYGENGHYEPFLLHMGGVAGVRGLMTLLPNQKLGIAILSNFGAMRVSMLTEAIRNKFLDLYMNLSQKDWSLDNLKKMQEVRDKNKQYKNRYRLQSPRKPHDLKAYVGVYENPLYGRFEIQQDKQGLVLVYRQKRVKLTHWNGDEFSFKGYDLTPVYSDYDQGYIEFAVRGQQAILSAINLMYEGKSEIFERVKD
jgi:CubicO group peptidase (beta-lactamase class C family)